MGWAKGQGHEGGRDGVGEVTRRSLGNKGVRGRGGKEAFHTVPKMP